jgi:hypothetical protein
VYKRQILSGAVKKLFPKKGASLKEGVGGVYTASTLLPPVGLASLDQENTPKPPRVLRAHMFTISDINNAASAGSRSPYPSLSDIGGAIVAHNHHAVSLGNLSQSSQMMDFLKRLKEFNDAAILKIRSAVWSMSRSFKGLTYTVNATEKYQEDGVPFSDWVVEELIAQLQK